ncbi:unnamed protein product [Brachionus calyciflorus]|uniref:BEN domain-containing protein n=1 Tax=Brachionus calyciflorus TaxID=104777 RepID=A0A814DF06_9BILA|nr:unnamed protein product [Brachionus calyciflorus]
MSNSETGNRKRKITSDNAKTDEIVDKKEEVLGSRKSPRLSANRSKEPPKVDTPPAPTRTRTRTKTQGEETKLNGAQFVTAAAAGNLNLTNSINEENEKTKNKNKKLELEKIQPDKLKKSEETKKQKLDSENSDSNNSPELDQEVQSETETDTQQEEAPEVPKSDDQIVILESEPSETKTDENEKLPEIITIAPEITLQTQTIKLIDTPIEDTNFKPSNNGLHNSDLNSSSDSSSDEDDEDSSSGNKRSSNGGKGGNIAILNKTKIDTEFISKLIGNKFPGDKRYDPNEINKLRLLSHSYQNFAVKLLVRLFDEEDIIGRNVYGRNYSGDKSITKQPLDPERINFIKETVLRLTKTNNPELAWASCVIAMNRKMVDINNKYFKNLKNKKQSEDDD